MESVRLSDNKTDCEKYEEEAEEADIYIYIYRVKNGCCCMEGCVLREIIGW